MNELTEREQQIQDFIREFVNEKGYPPSVREICKAVGLSSTATVHGYLTRLEKKGVLHRDSLLPRAISLKEPKQNVNAVPLLGRIAAGEPITAIEYKEDVVYLSEELTGNGEFFLLKLRGDSMIEAGILDGDMVVVRKQPTAENGDIVAALLEDEATIKRFFKENGNIRLQPENRLMKPIIVNNIVILGKVISLIRRY